MTFNRRELLAGGIIASLPMTLHAAAKTDAYLAALLFAFPLFEIARLAAASPVPRNTLAHRRTLADHNSRGVTMPNNDTLYSSCWLDLTKGPVDVDVPLDTGRYLSVAVMTAFTDVEAIISRRSHKGDIARVRILGPTDRSPAIKDRHIIRMPTQDVWLLGRTFVAGPEDLDAARVAQSRIVVAGSPSQSSAIFKPILPMTGENFLNVVNQALARCDTVLQRRAARHQSVGLKASERDAWRKLSEKHRQGWANAIARFNEGNAVSFTRFAKVIKGWSWPDNDIARFGNNDAFRAAVALSGIGALPASEAIYLTAVTDSDGRPLLPGQRYQLTLPQGGIPTDAFWSLSAYQAEPDGRFFFAPNPMNRYAINSAMMVGSIIEIAPNKPTNQDVAWLPVPDDPFRLVLRIYLPKENLRVKRDSLPPIIRIPLPVSR